MSPGTLKEPTEALEYLRELNVQLSHLYAFSRKINELDFAAALSGEFRGAQDAGWATTVTASEVYGELVALLSKPVDSTAQLRVVLMLYCQLAEAGGAYEALKNLLGVVKLKPYVLWPFSGLVRVKAAPKRIIGPNANATFRDLASSAESVGLVRLASLLEGAFRDDVRNGISHTDYVIWGPELRLRKRNGGYAAKLSIVEINDALQRGIGFFQLFSDHINSSVHSFNPPKTIIGKFSDNPPMPWTVSYSPESKTFGLRSDSPGAQVDAAYQLQAEINSRLGGKVMSIFWCSDRGAIADFELIASSAGFDPHYIELSREAFDSLVDDASRLELWAEAGRKNVAGDMVLLLTPWGLSRLESEADFCAALPATLLNYE